MDHPRGLFGRRSERHSGGAAEDLTTGRVDERVEPHGVALVLPALLLDVVGLALLGQLDRVPDHLVPRLGRTRNQILAVPEQLCVRVERRAVELAVVRGGRDRAREDSIRHHARQLPGPWSDPPGIREL